MILSFRNIVLKASLLVGMLAWSVPMYSQGAGAEMVEDPTNNAMAAVHGANRLNTFATDLTTKIHQVEQIIHNNKVTEALRKAYNQVSLYATVTQETITLSKNLYQTCAYTVDYIKNNLDLGLLSPAKASQMMTNLEAIVDAADREMTYIFDIILANSNEMTGTEQKEAIAAVGADLAAMMEQLQAEMEDLERRKAVVTVATATTHALKTGFFGEPSAATRQAISKQVKDQFKKQTGGKKTTYKVFDLAHLHQLGLILMGIIIMAYVPYNLYKYNKGERQAKDAMLKIFIALVFGPLLIYLFGVVFKV